jgi:hypothetical protein
MEALPMKKAVIVLLLCSLASTQIWADPGPDPAHAESIRKKVVKCLDQHKRVVIETNDGTRFLGVVSESGKDDFVLSYAGRGIRLSYQDVRRISWQSPVWKQVKVALGTVAIVGALVGLVALFGGFHD